LVTQDSPSNLHCRSRQRLLAESPGWIVGVGGHSSMVTTRRRLSFSFTWCGGECNHERDECHGRWDPRLQELAVVGRQVVDTPPVLVSPATTPALTSHARPPLLVSSASAPKSVLEVVWEVRVRDQGPAVPLDISVILCGRRPGHMCPREWRCRGTGGTGSFTLNSPSTVLVFRSSSTPGLCGR
jgi:hypothetical protein